MTLLGRYLGRELSWGVAITLSALVAIAYFVTFAAEMGHIGEEDFTSQTAVLYVLLRMPRIIHEMFPAAVLIGGLFAFGGLASSNELTIMRATGASVLGLLWQLRKIGLLLILVALVNMEWIVPSAERTAKVVKAMRSTSPLWSSLAMPSGCGMATILCAWIMWGMMALLRGWSGWRFLMPES